MNHCGYMMLFGFIEVTEKNLGGKKAGMDLNKYIFGLKNYLEKYLDLKNANKK